MTAKDTQTEAPGVESMPENGTEKDTGDGAQESAPAITDFPSSMLRTKPVADSSLTYVDNLEQLLTDCYETNRLPSENGQMPWAVAGRVIDLRHYDYFPQNAG